MMTVYVIAIGAPMWGLAESLPCCLSHRMRPRLSTIRLCSCTSTLLLLSLLGMLSILRYTIQERAIHGWLRSPVCRKMVARVLVSLIVVPLWGFWACVWRDPTAWLFANLVFLVPAFIYVPPFATDCRKKDGWWLIPDRHPVSRVKGGISRQRATSAAIAPVK